MEKICICDSKHMTFAKKVAIVDLIDQKETRKTA